MQVFQNPESGVLGSGDRFVHDVWDTPAAGLFMTLCRCRDNYAMRLRGFAVDFCREWTNAYFSTLRSWVESATLFGLWSDPLLDGAVALQADAQVREGTSAQSRTYFN